MWRGWLRILEHFRWVLGIFIVRMGRLVGPDGERTNYIRHQHLHSAHTILVAFTSLWREYKETGKLRSDISVLLFLVPYARIWGIFLDFRNVLCLNSVHIWLVVLVHTLDWTTSPNFSHDFVLEEGNWINWVWNIQSQSRVEEDESEAGERVAKRACQTTSLKCPVIKLYL